MADDPKGIEVFSELPGQAGLLGAEFGRHTGWGYLAAAYRNGYNRGGQSFLSANQGHLPAASGIWCYIQEDFVFLGWQARPHEGRLVPYLTAWCQKNGKLYDIENLHEHDYEPFPDNGSGQLGGWWKERNVRMGIKCRQDGSGWAFIVNGNEIGYLKASFFPAEECTAIQFGGYTNQTGWGYQQEIQYLADDGGYCDCDLHKNVGNPDCNDISIAKHTAKGTCIKFGTPQKLLIS